MTTTLALKKLLHPKAWETDSILPANTAAGSFVASDKFDLINGSKAFVMLNYSAVYMYEGDNLGFIQLPNSGLAGTFGAGACGEFRSLSAMGGSFTNTATAGSTTTLTTNRTIVRACAGMRIRVIAGAGLGYDGTIASNTIGANAVITVTTPSGVAFDATTQYQIFGGSLWVQGAGASSGFSVYDRITNAWTARAATGTTWGTDGVLVSTIGAQGSFATGTATAGGATTLTRSTAAWGTNMWANYQIRITAGVGAGQIRTIASNTGTVITVSAAWAVNPDATSVYAIEGNHDHFYLLGNNAVTLYRYTVSTNTWATLSPTAARAAALGAGGTASWIDSVPEWEGNETLIPLNVAGTLYRQNGRYIYSFRGAGSNVLDIYDIAANTWVSGLPYGNQQETFTTGTSSVDYDGKIYISKEATGRYFMFDVNKNILESLCQNYQPNGAAVVGNKLWLLPYHDGATDLPFLYQAAHTSNLVTRMAVF
jgi:hypothetical protein